MFGLLRRFESLRKRIEDTETLRKETEGEISLAGVIYFLRSNFKFFCLAALVFCVVAVVLALLVPKNYEKRVDLSAQPVPNVLLGSSSEVNLEEVSIDSFGYSAAAFVQAWDFGNVNVIPRYDDTARRVELDLRSWDPGSLDEIGPEAVGWLEDALQQALEVQLGPALEARQTELDSSWYKDEEFLAEVEQQIEQTSADADPRDADTTARLTALEKQRVEMLERMASTERDLEDLKQPLKDPSRLAAEMVSVKVLDESEARESSSLAQRIWIAVLFGFVAAAAATVVRGVSGKKKPHA